MNKDGFTIIIVDDDEDDQIIFREALKRTRFKLYLKTVNNGTSFLDLIASKKSESKMDSLIADFIVLDINMPDINGLKVLEKLKNDKVLNDTPVFILSTSNKKEDINNALRLGAKKFYTKPSTVQGFEEIFKEIISSL